MYSLPSRYSISSGLPSTETATQKTPSRTFAPSTGRKPLPKEFSEWVAPYRRDFDAQQASLHGGILDTASGMAANSIANTLERRL